MHLQRAFYDIAMRLRTSTFPPRRVKGSSIQNLAPFPGSLSTPIEPPRSAVSSLLIDNPAPCRCEFG